jgi:hypothetical protein
VFASGEPAWASKPRYWGLSEKDKLTMKALKNKQRGGRFRNWHTVREQARASGWFSKTNTLQSLMGK